MALVFEQDLPGSWCASSRIADDGDAFQWKIEVNDSGFFDVSSSDSELLSIEHPRPFASLSEAVAWCGYQEHLLVLTHYGNIKPAVQQQTIAEATAMTKLDVFASQALIAMISESISATSELVSECYDIAEAMVAESEKRSKAKTTPGEGGEVPC